MDANTLVIIASIVALFAAFIAWALRPVRPIREYYGEHVADLPRYDPHNQG
ncbi:hypothetical protein SAMN05519103_00326 [Rhizobiales bacterium GAS113]|nr:hypothetical protein SAMN05519103_00326 [Rhizobiales bacterium GAS113]